MAAGSVRARVPAVAVALGLLLALASPAPAPAEGHAELRDAPSATGDSLSRRLRSLLAADSLDLDSLDVLLREDSLAEDRARSGPLAPPRTDTLGGVDADTVRGDRPGSLAKETRAPLPTPGSRRDTVGFRWELGASSDLINEQFYEYRDAIFDTVSRSLVSEPETRVAGVAAMSLEGTRARGGIRYRLHDETSIGNALQRTTLDLVWRDERLRRWKLLFLPWLDARHDRTFGRDLTEWHATGTVRARRLLGDGDSDLELGARGELLRASGPGADFLLDRQAASVSAAFDRMPLLGDEARVGYAFTVRTFPDSSVRDHLEHAWEGRWRRSLAGAGWVAIETDGEVRGTLERAPTTRDNFWRGHVLIGGEREIVDRFWMEGRIEGEVLEFQIPDTLLYFDERVLRVVALPGWRPSIGRSFAAGPRVERLWCPRQPAEEYTDVAAVTELEWSGRASWWRVTPAVGRRLYDMPLRRERLVLSGLHTSHTFYELGVIADQRLPGALRLRALMDGRIESHTDPADDARSLYFSLDLRMLF